MFQTGVHADGPAVVERFLTRWVRQRFGSKTSLLCLQALEQGF